MTGANIISSLKGERLENGLGCGWGLTFSNNGLVVMMSLFESDSTALSALDWKSVEATYQYPHALGPGLSRLMYTRGCPSGPPPTCQLCSRKH
jgi:hypothetical protein